MHEAHKSIAVALSIDRERHHTHTQRQSDITARELEDVRRLSREFSDVAPYIAILIFVHEVHTYVCVDAIWTHTRERFARDYHGFWADFDPDDVDNIPAFPPTSFGVGVGYSTSHKC
jgi:hypothetical protein